MGTQLLYFMRNPDRERLWHPKPYMRTIRYQYYQEYDPTNEDQQTAKFKWHKTTYHLL